MSFGDERTELEPAPPSSAWSEPELATDENASPEPVVDLHAQNLWSCLEAIARADFSVSIEPVRGGYVFRARPTVIRADRPVTKRLADGIFAERPDLRDAAAQVLTAITLEIAVDADERRKRWAEMDREDHAALRAVAP